MSYDVQAVNEFVEAMQQEHPAQWPQLLAIIAGAEIERETGMASADERAIGWLRQRFDALTPWEQTNALYRLADAMRQAIVRAARVCERRAREGDRT